jgi:hypothetical protein
MIFFRKSLGPLPSMGGLLLVTAAHVPPSPPPQGPAPTWEDIAENKFNYLLMMTDPLRNCDMDVHTKAGSCSCGRGQRLCKMGTRGGTSDIDGYRCLGCEKQWWFHPYAEGLACFLWDGEFRSRVPTHMWLLWMCDASIPFGNDYYEILTRTGGSMNPKQYYWPPKESCPGFTTEWPHGMLNHRYGA